MNAEQINQIAAVLEVAPDSSVTLTYCKEADDFVAQWFDGRHEAAALIAVADKAHVALEYLAEMMLHELV